MGPRIGDWGKRKTSQGQHSQRMEAWNGVGGGGMQAWDVNEGRRAWGHEGDQAEGQEPRLHGQGQTKDLSQRKCQRRRSRAGKGKPEEENWSFVPLLFCGLMLICCCFQDKDGLHLVDQSDQPLIFLTEESGSFWGK